MAEETAAAVNKWTGWHTKTACGIGIWLAVLVFLAGHDFAVLDGDKMSAPSMVIGWGGLIFLCGTLWGGSKSHG
jgi:hypothetical protein